MSKHKFTLRDVAGIAFFLLGMKVMRDETYHDIMNEAMELAGVDHLVTWGDDND